MLLQLLNLETATSTETLRRIIATAPRRYKVYQIPKRNGGERTIAHPAKELKLLQRVVLREILNKAPVGALAMAYVKGRGIVDNARKHIGQRWILKLDFEKFFPSITPADWDRTVRRMPELKHLGADRLIFHRLLFWGVGTPDPLCLSIGAPTSPAVSNLVCFWLDRWLSEQASQRGIVISRYADDITASGSNVRQLIAFEKALTLKLENNKGIQFRLNAAKRGLYGPGERRMVTGLILTPDAKISIGRERKREISALIHKFSIGVADEEVAARARGLLSFANAAEPSFCVSMRNKYGQGVFDTLMAGEAPVNSILIHKDD